jgi:hypothetical protein
MYFQRRRRRERRKKKLKPATRDEPRLAREKKFFFCSSLVRIKHIV